MKQFQLLIIVMKTSTLLSPVQSSFGKHSNASLFPPDLKMCGEERTLWCNYDQSDFPLGATKINVMASTATKPQGQKNNILFRNGKASIDFTMNNIISEESKSPIIFLCAAKSNNGNDWVFVQVAIPLIYPPTQAPTLLINGTEIVGQETSMPLGGTFNASCSVVGGHPSTNLTLTCRGHDTESGNNSVQMLVKQAFKQTKCTCRGTHPSECYLNNTTEVTLRDTRTTGQPTVGTTRESRSDHVSHECPYHTYGKNCSRFCPNCRDDCDKETGECLTGCLPGWSNKHCRQPDCTQENCGKRKCHKFDNVTKVCSCLAGYENSSHFHCKDIDECKKPDICYSHTCINTNGSYECRCRSGHKNIALQTCVQADDFIFQNSDKKNEIFLFNLKTITPHKLLAMGLSYVVIGFILLAVIECAMTIVNVTTTFATSKPLKGLHSHMLKNHYIAITYDEAEDSDVKSDDTSVELKYSEQEDEELSSPSASSSSSEKKDDEYEQGEENDEQDQEDEEQDHEDDEQDEEDNKEEDQ